MDASKKVLGTILYQTQDDGTSRVIPYNAHKLEFLALKWAVTDKFYEYLYGGDFEVFTNNNPFTYILTMARLDATGQRWVVSLANLSYIIKVASST